MFRNRSERRRNDARNRVLEAIRMGVAYGFDICEKTGMSAAGVYPALASLEREGRIVRTLEQNPVCGAEMRPRTRYQMPGNQ